MKSVHIRDLPESVLERLKQRAAQHHRSLQGELHYVLTEAAQAPLPGDEAEMTLTTVRTRGVKNWSREALYED